MDKIFPSDGNDKGSTPFLNTINKGCDKMLGSITCDTPISDIISMSDISGDLEAVDSSLKSFEKEVSTTITEEQTGGGLSATAFTLDDKPVLVEKSNKVIDQMEASNIWSGIRSQIVCNLETQRKAEIKRLKEKVIEKIHELETEINKIRDYLAKAANAKEGDSFPDVGRCQERLPVAEAELEKYKEKEITLEGMS